MNVLSEAGAVIHAASLAAGSGINRPVPGGPESLAAGVAPLTDEVVLFFTVLGWVFWAVFVAKFLLRAYIAGFSGAFWKKN